MKRWIWVVLVFAAVLRCGHWWVVRDYPFVATLALDGQEYDRLARELAAGDWLGDEAFYMAPLYIYVVGVAYWIFGPTPHAVYLLQILAALACVWVVWILGRRLGGERLGVIAAAMCAGSWILVLYDVLLVKDGLAALVTALLFLAIDRVRDALHRWPWELAAGALSAGLALLRENALLLLPLFALFAVAPSLRKRTLVAVASFAAGIALVIGPVALRNWLVSGYPLPSSYAGGTNLYVGNNPEADGMWRPILPARQSPAIEQLALQRIASQAAGRELEAAEVSGWWRQRVVDWAFEEPWAFVRLQLRKVWLTVHPYEFPDTLDPYWFRERSPFLQLAVVERGALMVLAVWGMMLVWREPRWRPMVVFVPAWVLAIAVFFIFARYRLPLIPVLCLLAAVPIDRAIGDLGSERVRRARLVLLIAVLILVGFRALPWTPRYGLVEYNLGRLAEEAGDLESAEVHYREARRHDPQDFVMAMNLGTVLARRGNLAEAFPLLQEAARLAPGSAEAAANLGAAHLARGELERATVELDRASQIDHHYLPALLNRAVIAMSQGDHERVRTILAQVETLDPGNSGAARLRARLETAAEADDPADGLGAAQD